MKVRPGLLLILACTACFCDDLSDALRGKRYQDALAQTEVLLRTNPRAHAIWTARGYALEGLSQDRESLDSFETALKLAPDYLPALKGAAEVSYRSHDRRSLGFLGQLLRIDPSNMTAHGMAGVLAFESGDCPSANRHFKMAGSDLLQNTPAYSLYGACLLAEHRAPEAIAVFKKLLSDGVSQTNKLSDLLDLLASAEAQAGKTEDALDHFRQAVKLSPKEERAYFDLAAFCIQHDNLPTATDVVRTGLQNVPDTGRLRALQGVIDAQSGRYDEAAAQFEMANDLDPKAELGAAGLGALYLERNQPDSAVTALRHRLQANPNDPTLSYFLAEALMQQSSEAGTGLSQQDEEARQALLKSLQAKPDFAKAHALLGKLYIRKGDDAKAVDELRLAAKYDPSSRLALSQMAIALRHLGRKEEAAVTLSKLRAIVLAESNVEADLSRMRSAQSPTR